MRLLLVVAVAGGGNPPADGGNPPAPTGENKLPTANAGGDINIFGANKVTLDASGSSDVDGSIVEYTWSEGAVVLGKGVKLSDLSFAEGAHTITLTIKDNLGATATDTLAITAECTEAVSMALVNDANGTVNFVGANEKSEMCYKIDLSSNNGVETYLMYMNLYNGTHSNVTFENKVKLYDENGAEAHQFYTNYMIKEGGRFGEPFEISFDGTYYVKVYRDGNEPSRFGFSIHPSLNNGLKQDNDRELNDYFTIAAPITLDEAMKDINGSLNLSGVQENSLKNTDYEDYYSIDFAKAGGYAFYVNLYNGTQNNNGVDYIEIELFDENYASVYKFPAKAYQSGQRFSGAFTVPLTGKYYFKLSRAKSEATRYGFSIHPSVANGLVQDTDRELNDFMSMAAPIAWTDIDNNITGSLNVDRTSIDSSIKNSDSTDFYVIDFTEGSYMLNLTLLDGTDRTTNILSHVNIILRKSDGAIEKTFSDLQGPGKLTDGNFTIPSNGLYFLSIDRTNAATEYTFTIQKP